MSYQPVNNPWDIVNNPPPPVMRCWGKLSLEAHTVVLIKGVGKMPYDPNQLMPDGSEPKPVVSLKIAMTALPEMGLQYPEILREPLATSRGEWAEITLPSIRDCGVMQAETLHGKYAVAELVSTGRSYTNRNGNKTEATTFKFIQIFASEAECRADYFQSRGQPANTQQPATQQPAVQPPATQPPLNGSNGNGSNSNGGNRETAVKFLAVFAKQAVTAGGGDLEKIRGEMSVKIANNALLAQYFTVDSPEVVEALAAEMAK